MKVLYYDCFAGISGDMNLGAMIDLGVDEEYIIKELSKLNIEDEFNLEVKKDIRKGISGTKVDVIPNKPFHKENMHNARNLKDIKEIINRSDLKEEVKEISLKIFFKIAEAEGKIHNKDINKVHFHEVGATDSIVDIIGAAICADYLKVDRIICSSVQLGTGYVECQHGLFPIPAPATVELLKGVPIKSGIVPFEMTTPTGAAILSVIVDEFSDFMNFTTIKVGYGIGGRDTEIANVLRVFLGETEEKFLYEEATVIECNIDDMNPEIYEYIFEKLFSEGAQDVYLSPIIMKKSRPGITLCALVDIKDEEKIENLILAETTTLGIRKYRVNKKMLNREMIKVETVYGKISVKVAHINGQEIKFKPEYDECKRISLEHNIPISKIYYEVNKSFYRK